MLIIILAAYFGTFIGREMYKDSWDNTGRVLAGMTMFVGGVVGILLGFSVAIGIGYAFPQDFIETDKVEIVALQDGSQTEGHFFLGSGSIEGVQYYFYYQKDGSGYKQGKVKVEGTTVYEDGNNYIQFYGSKFDWSLVYLVALPGKVKTEIHIPNGSIIKDFRLDLQ